MSMLPNLVTGGWFSLTHIAFFATLAGYFAQKGRKASFMQYASWLWNFIPWHFMNAVVYLGQRTNLWKKKKFNWALNLDVNFVHFLTCRSPEARTVLWRKVSRCFSYLFVYSSKGILTWLLLEAAYYGRWASAWLSRAIIFVLLLVVIQWVQSM